MIMYKSLALLVVLFFILKALFRCVQIALSSRRHGCQSPVCIPQSERILGWGLFRIQLAASRSKTTLDLSLSRYREYGNTWSACMVGKRIINTIEPENVKAVLATNFKDYGLGKRQLAWGPLLGEGIFTTDGAQWEHSRAIVRPSFSRAQVADLGGFERHIQRLICKIPTDGSKVDLQALFFQLTLDSSTEFLFGSSVDSLASPEGSENQMFSAAYDLAQSRLPNRGRLGKLVHLYRDSEFDAACEVVHTYVDKIVRDALEKVYPKDAEKSLNANGTEPQRYIFLMEMIKSTHDSKRLRDELLNILLAGRDTTASLLSNTFHVLVRRPDIWKSLKKEVDGLKGVKPDYETLRSMKFVKNLLNESLRLYPVVPVNGRFSDVDTILPTGGGPSGTSPVFVPANTVVAWHTYSMHRRTDIYGADADEFRPERWDAEEGLRPGWGYLPFNGGPRICVGQIFALTHASYAIVRLVQELSEKSLDMEDRDGSPWVEGLSLTACSAKGVQVALVPSTDEI